MEIEQWDLVLTRQLQQGRQIGHMEAERDHEHLGRKYFEERWAAVSGQLIEAQITLAKIADDGASLKTLLETEPEWDAGEDLLAIAAKVLRRLKAGQTKLSRKTGHGRSRRSS